MNIPGYKRVNRDLEKAFNESTETPGHWWFRVTALDLHVRYDPSAHRWFFPRNFTP